MEHEEVDSREGEVADAPCDRVVTAHKPRGGAAVCADLSQFAECLEHHGARVCIPSDRVSCRLIPFCKFPGRGELGFGFFVCVARNDESGEGEAERLSLSRTRRDITDQVRDAIEGLAINKPRVGDVSGERTRRL